MRRPNFFLIGAAKSATTSLYTALAGHPEIYVSPLKEPHFFASFEVDPRTARLHGIVRDEHRYLELFRGAASEPVVGEGSTSYLWDEAAAGRIAAAAPGAKIVAILRDPVERAYSHYLNDVREGRETRTFAEAVTEELERPEAARWPSAYVGFGHYAEQLGRYVERFDDVLVLFFEDYVADPPRRTRRVLEVLGVDPGVPVAPSPENAFARPRSELARRLFGFTPARLVARGLVPPRFRPAGRRLVWAGGEKAQLDPAVRALLEDVYLPERSRVAELAGAEPPWASR